MKKIKIFLLVFVIIAVCFLILFFSRRNKPTQTIVPSAPDAVWNKIQPGVSTQKDITDLLGTPLSHQTQDGKDVTAFKSTSPTRNNEVVFENGKSTLIKRIISTNDAGTYGTQVSFKYFTSQFGQEEKILYGPDTEAGDFLYTYPSKGVAILGSELSNTVLEVWYFPKSTLKDFETTWAKDYSEERTLPQGF